MASQYIELMFTGLLQHFGPPLRGLPSQCAVCHAWDWQRLCADCITRYVAPCPRCERCAIEVPLGVRTCGACLKQPPPFEHALAAVDYKYPWDGLITALKFHAGLDLATVLAQRVIEAYGKGELPRPGWLLPVPLSAQRLRERGYNQAWELARRVAPALGCTTHPRWLLRVKDSPQQLSLPLAQRAANVRGAFAVAPRRADELREQTVAVLDDVMTSGATAAEIARTLLGAGAKSVQVWVVARTPRITDL